MSAAASPSRNHLLSRLSAADTRLLQPGLKPIALQVCHYLEEPNKPIKYVYFLDSGMASHVALTARKRKIEVGIIGREGVSSLAVVMGGDRSPNENYIQIKGSGQRIRSEALRRAMQDSASLHHSLLQFAQTFLIQSAHTALANATAKIDERLARWLLMAHDRVDGDDIPLTHEFLALMLGVRRAGVTVALQMLEGNGLVGSSRGVVHIINRRGLARLADGLYGTPEAEAARLTGWRSPHAH